MSQKTALITGVTGQDGSYLVELLQTKGYQVHGVVRRSSELPADIGGKTDVLIHISDLTDDEAIARVIGCVKPDECYHLAAQTFVTGQERETLRVNAEGTLLLLDALHKHAPRCRLFYAGSSEMFGDVSVSPQDETTPFHPRNVYGVSKVTGFQLMSVYRSQHSLFACCGILYNHESPRRGNDFVTRKISKAVARIRSGDLDVLRLGNLKSVRDWGHARDYVRAMWLCLQQKCPDDYVIATGQGRSVQDFVERAFATVTLDWHSHVREVPEYYRPAEPIPLIGCSDKARRLLGWSPETDFEELVSEMVFHDLELLLNQRTSAGTS